VVRSRDSSVIISTIRLELIYQAISRACIILDYKILKDIHDTYEYVQQNILVDNSLTEDEKTEAIRLINKDYKHDKIINNSRIKRICENRNQECLATILFGTI
jgi:hypothetical protein